MSGRIPALVLVLALGAGCRSTAPRSADPRVRPGPAASDEERAERSLLAAEARCKRRPRDRASWRSLHHAAGRAGQPHRYLLALEATESRGRLPSELRATLARLLRRRARNLAHLGAPAAALRTMARADRLAVAPEGQRGAWETLRDRMALAQADRWLAIDEAGAARKVYRDLARRGVLDGESLQWRRAALGDTQGPLALAVALGQLRDRAPGPAQRLARAYLKTPKRDPGTLLAALEAATLGTDQRLVRALDVQLAKVAPARLLEAACRLRRRPGSPCCQQLQRWATTNTDALGRWVDLCRELHWIPGDGPWLASAIRLQKNGGQLGLGPLEGVVSNGLARQAAKVLAHHPTLGRLGGQSAGHRKTLCRSMMGNTTYQLLLRAFESWAAGLAADAHRDLALATNTLVQPAPGAKVEFARRCQLLRLTRLVRGPAAAYRLMSKLAQADAPYGRHLVARLLARGELPAALGLARPDQRKRVIARLRELGRVLARWRVAGNDALKKHWSQRYGSDLAKRAWGHVTAGAKASGAAAPSTLERVLRLAGQGRLTEAETEIKTKAMTRRTRPPRPWTPRYGLWQAWIPHLGGHPKVARRGLRRLRHRDPGGFRWLRLVVPSLTWLGHNRTAGGLADALYERSLTDPVLLRLVVQGAVAAGRYDKAELALTDWASATGRPDRAYLTAARWLATRGQWSRAAALSSRALGWSGTRPLGAAVVTLRHQRAARRKAEARRTAAWLLARWPAGNARDGISQTLAASLLAAEGPTAAQPYSKLKRGLDLPALLKKRRFKVVQGRAAARSSREPLSAAWPALAALAAQGRRQWQVAGRYVDQVAERSPRLEPLARALLLADQGRIVPALAWLAVASLTAQKHALWIDSLAAALASRAGKRRLAARLLSHGIVSQPATDRGATAGDLARMKTLAAGKLLPLQIPWAVLTAAPDGARSCAP